MSSDTEEYRARLRAHVLEQRSALSDEQLSAASRELSRLVESTPEYQQSTHVAAYWPVRGEADVRPLIERALASGKQVYLPVVCEGGTLLFAPYDQDTPMKDNRLKIPEPDVSADRLVSPRDIELVIVPLTVFDDHGNRLGMGGGFYDRTFAFLNEEPQRRSPVLVGAAHEFQHTERLPACDWDVPTRLVVSDQRVRRPGQPGTAVS